jgi:hypothetical protein
LGNFCLKPFRMWYKSIKIFNHHEKYNYHLQSVEKNQNVIAIETGKHDSIDLQLNKAAKVQKEFNRKIYSCNRVCDFLRKTSNRLMGTS